jgi:cell shape-determining protein MreD
MTWTIVVLSLYLCGTAAIITSDMNEDMFDIPLWATLLDCLIWPWILVYETVRGLR